MGTSLGAQQSVTGDSARVAPPVDTATVAATPAPAPAAAPLPRLPLPDKWRLRTGLSASVLYGNRERRILGKRTNTAGHMLVGATATW